MTGHRAIAEATANGGFLTADQIDAIASDSETRLTMVLVRCGGGRFITPAQDVQHFIGIIDRERGDNPEAEFSDSDYVRDCSLAVQPAARRGY